MTEENTTADQALADVKCWITIANTDVVVFAEVVDRERFVLPVGNPSRI